MHTHSREARNERIEVDDLPNELGYRPQTLSWGKYARNR